jgi:hypothetical protein
MNETKPPAPDLKPVAVFLDRGRVITQEFISRDGHILAGYRTTPEATGFPAWARRGDIVNGFRETTRRWFSTADAVRVWTLAQVSGEHQSAPVSGDVTDGVQHKGEAA